MNYEALFAPHVGKKLRVGLAGAGEFGRSFLFRSGRAPGLEVVAVADRDMKRAQAAVSAAGIDPAKVTIVGDAGELAGLALDVIVEATGEPEVAARTADLALAAGKHVAMVTKEADCVVGPILQEKAERAGLAYTVVDGDQPSLLVSLVSWARALGLEVVCGGKSGEFDFIYDPARETVTGPAGSMALKDGASFWRDPGTRGKVLGSWQRATVPDYCEMAIVANATGLRPDLPELHAPVARTLELPDLFRPREAGGMLAAPGAVDMFVCLRRPDELSFAGGVFVIVRCDDRASWQVLRGKGIPVSEDGGYAMLHNPVHLLGIEAPLSIFSAVLLGAPAARLKPAVDVHARATQRLSAGHVLAIGERHAVQGLEPLIAPAGAAAQDAALPYYMAAGCRLRAPVEAGALVRRSMVEAPAGSTLWRLRDEQDARFFA